MHAVAASRSACGTYEQGVPGGARSCGSCGNGAWQPHCGHMAMGLAMGSYRLPAVTPSSSATR
eukprot:7377470-Prymnesium_polylepis.2